MKVIIIGAGISGLTAALLLAHAGREVTLLEAGPAPGGKLHQAAAGTARIDAGPTVFTMRPVFEAIFAAAGARLQDHLQLRRLDCLARHFWEDGSQLDLFDDPTRNEAAIEAFAGTAAAAGYRRFAARAKRIYELLDRPFMQAPQPGLAGLIAKAGPGLLGISPFATLWDELGKYFTDPRLRQLFARYATYCGSSPFQAPATLMLIAHAELLGVWAIEGGMIRLAEAFSALITARGGNIIYNAPVTAVRVRQGRVAGARAGGQDFAAEAVIATADLAALEAGLLGPAAQAAVAGFSRGSKPSYSALTWAMTGRATASRLVHHNVFFAKDSAAEFGDLRNGTAPRDPTVYLCAPRPGEFFCLANAPAAAPPSPTSWNVAQAKLLRCGVDLQPEQMVTTTPADWASKFPGSAGALYGRALAGWKDSFARPGSRTKLPGFFIAGGGVHPGPGLPMAATSGRLAAQCVLTSR